MFSSILTVVEVYATVSDADGRAVAGLRRENFVVLENGERQTVTTFVDADFPLSTALAIDRSASMTGESLALAKVAANAFLKELGPADKAMIVAIGTDVQIVSPLSTDRVAQQTAIRGLDALGTTALNDAIIKAIDGTRPSTGRRAVVLLSDGIDRYSRATGDQVLAHARAANVPIYPVAFGEERSQFFAQLAALSGGRFFHVTDAAQLPNTLRQIAAELRHQYLLGYTPSRPIETGRAEWRAIEVKVVRPGLQVRARDGYQTKEP